MRQLIRDGSILWSFLRLSPLVYVELAELNDAMV
jgi:hypothetical protein